MGSDASKNVKDVQPKSDITKACVLGGGAFGTAMAQVLARNGVKVSMWVLEPEVVEEINSKHKNTVFLEGVDLHHNISASSDFQSSLVGAQLVLVVIPTPFLRRVVVKQHQFLPKDVPIVCCTKGIENETLLTPFEILIEELPGKYHGQLAAISGPSFAIELARAVPTSCLVASENPATAKKVQLAMSDETFRLSTGNDIIGAELSGALKNVIAIACGASAGLGMGHNTLALLITQGLSELTQLAMAKGANPSTMSGLAGMGDLVLTCTSSNSRNFTVGTRLAKGETMVEMAKTMKTVAEGVKTSQSVHTLSQQLGLTLPLCDAVYKVLHEGKDIKEAMSEFANRPLEEEFNAYERYVTLQQTRSAL